MALGIAEVIPGISGGTLALILGIYERLINAIHSFDLSLLRSGKERRMSLAWKQVDGNFSFILLAGMLISIFTSYFRIGDEKGPHGQFTEKN